MQRTQYRCLAVSVGIHCLLMLLLFVGPAFLPSKPPGPPPLPNDIALIDFIPLKTTDELISGGGNPKASARAAETPPVVEPTPPPPSPEPEEKPTPRQKSPEPKRAPAPEPKQAPAPVEKNPDAFEPQPRKPKVPQISTEIVTRKNTKAQEAKERERERARKEAAERERQEREYYEKRQRLASNLSRAANSLSEGLSSSTTVELRGPGGGGVPYANFFLAVKSRYDAAWVVPDGVIDSAATAVAEITIGRDGRVLNWRIIRRSGNSLMDRTVEDTLYRVKHAAPLPDTEKADQRTVTIDFNARSKRART